MRTSHSVFMVMVAGLVAAGVACTRPNPNVCCVTALQCDALGIDEPRPCDVGQACQAGGCVAAECAVTADCADPANPICSHGLCIGSCQGDEDCADVDGRPHCSAQGVCVGCLDAAQCPASAAICDGGTNTCRGCTQDSECAGGVCLEADGVCAPDATVVFVSGSGGTDSGDCSRTAPCRTLAYAFGRTSVTRNVISTSSGSLPPEASTLSVFTELTIDGNATVIPVTTNGSPIFHTTMAGRLALEGVTVDGTGLVASPSLRITAGGGVRVGLHSELRGAAVINGGTLTLENSSVGGEVECTNGTFAARSTDFSRVVTTTNCQTSIVRSRLRGADRLLAILGGSASVINSLFVQSYELSDSIYISAVNPGSSFAFNTVVNTSGVTSDGVALNCDSSLAVTSNIFAYRSQHPHGPGAGCRTHYSLYDDVASAFPTPPLDAQMAPIGTFFTNLTAKDFHLASTSPARGKADPAAMVQDDLEGNPRPAPAGTRADVGAFEAP